MMTTAAPTMPDPDRMLRHAARLQEFSVLQDRLQGSGSVSELLALGAELAAQGCDCERGLIVAVRDGRLTADASEAIGEPDSDLLRRRVLAAPVTIVPATLEAELIGRGMAVGAPEEPYPSLLAEALGLRRPLLAGIALESAIMAILVVDGPRGAPDELDRAMLGAYAALLAVALGYVVTRTRIEELSTELRHLTVSARALALEAFHAPAALPIRGRRSSTFPFVDGIVAAPSSRAAAALTDRERQIAALLARGRSNREIAAELFLSPETVKDAVGRVVRKLGAGNRIEAAIRFVGMEHGPLLGA